MEKTGSKVTDKYIYIDLVGLSSLQYLLKYNKGWTENSWFRWLYDNKRDRLEEIAELYWTQQLEENQLVKRLAEERQALTKKHREAIQVLIDKLKD